MLGSYEESRPKLVLMTNQVLTVDSERGGEGSLRLANSCQDCKVR